MASQSELLERALEEYEKALIGYAYNLLGNIETAKEVVQDCLVKLCHQDPSQIEKNLKAWLYTVCRNGCYDILRKESKRRFSDPEILESLPDKLASPDEQLEHQEKYEQATALLERLSENQREVIVLKIQQGLSYKEIEKVTGLSQSNIGFLIHTGLKKVRGWIEEA